MGVGLQTRKHYQSQLSQCWYLVNRTQCGIKACGQLKCGRVQIFGKTRQPIKQKRRSEEIGIRLSSGMPATIQDTIFCLPVRHPKVKRFIYTEPQIYLLFCMGVKLDHSYWGKNKDWRFRERGAKDIWNYEGRGNCLTDSFINCIPHQILFGWSNNE
jgi:hypothetical protein